MPAIRAPRLEALREVAASWRVNHPGVCPSEITLETRLRSSQARAAFFIWQLGDRDLHPLQGCCDLCGELTASWCEGCYLRCGATPLTFSSVCQPCDSLKKVCALCGDLGITYAQGHRAYGVQRQQGSTDTIEIQVVESGTGSGA